MAAIRGSQDIVEVLAAASGDVRAEQNVVEVLFPRITPSPTTITGAGITQDVVEVLAASSQAYVRMTSFIVEVLHADNSIPPSGGGGTTSFGYVG